MSMLLNKIAIFKGPNTNDVVLAALEVYRLLGDMYEIEVITPRSLAHEIECEIYNYPIRIRFDEDLNGYSEVSSWLMANEDLIGSLGRSVGWYKQQYLKMSYAYSQSGKFFLQDGDTIFSPCLLRKLSSELLLLTTKENPIYYNSACKAYGLEVINNLSFVSNGAVFDGKQLREFIGNLEVWFIEAIAKVLRSPEEMDFSEYQIMGNLISSSPQMSFYPLRFFRRMELVLSSTQGSFSVDLLMNAFKRYDAIAFERTHGYSFVKKIMARACYLFGYSW